MRRSLLTLFICFGASFVPSHTTAMVADLIAVTGELGEKDGTPLSGSYTMTFSLYNAEKDGEQIWQEIYDGDNKVEIKDGFLSIYLGSLTSLDFADLVAAPELWLGVIVGSDSEMNRIRLASVPFSLEAQVCRQVGDLTEADIQPLLGEACAADEYLRGWNAEQASPICSPLADVAISGSFGDLSDVPLGLQDGDDDTTYRAGTGLSLSLDNTFSVQQSQVEEWARDVCYDTTQEVVDAVEGVYAPAVHSHSWSELTNKPAGFADGVDNDTTYTAGKGVELVGTEFRAKGSPYARVIVVAKDGGDFTDVQTAVDSVADATAESPVLIRAMPGRYVGVVTLKPNVHLRGSGRDVTVLTSDIGNNDWKSVSQATLVIPSHVRVDDLTVENNGTNQVNAAVLAPEGTDDVYLRAVSARAVNQNTGSVPFRNCGVYLEGTGTELVLESVVAEGMNVADYNIGLFVGTGAKATLIGGTYRGVGNGSMDGAAAHGIYAVGTIEMTDAVVRAEHSGSAFALSVSDDGNAKLTGGIFVARDSGVSSVGISVGGNGVLNANDVLASASFAISNYGIEHTSSVPAIIKGGSFLGEGGDYAYGVYLEGSTLNGVTATGKGAQYTNVGLEVVDDGAVRAIGGQFSGSGGLLTSGARVEGTLDLSNAYVSGSGASEFNYGVYLIEDSVEATHSTLEGADNAVHVMDGGIATVRHTHFVGGPVSGATQCLAVSRGGTFSASTCP